MLSLYLSIFPILSLAYYVILLPIAWLWHHYYEIVSGDAGRLIVVILGGFINLFYDANRLTTCTHKITYILIKRSSNKSLYKTTILHGTG